MNDTRRLILMDRSERLRRRQIAESLGSKGLSSALSGAATGISQAARGCNLKLKSMAAKPKFAKSRSSIRWYVRFALLVRVLSAARTYFSRYVARNCNKITVPE